LNESDSEFVLDLSARFVLKYRRIPLRKCVILSSLYVESAFKCKLKFFAKARNFSYSESPMLRKRGKMTVFLHIGRGYVKKALKNEGLPSHRARLR